MARSGLGRGLDVLLGQAAAVATPVVDRPSTSEIPLEQVRPNRHQPRSAFDPEGLSELAASISRHGVLQPIVVSQDGAGYELVAGHRRVLAARLAGIPAVWHLHDQIASNYLAPQAVAPMRVIIGTLPSAVVAVSRATLNTVKWFRPGMRTAVIPGPIPMLRRTSARR